MFRPLPAVAAAVLLALSGARAQDAGDAGSRQAELERVRSRIEALTGEIEKSKDQADELQRGLESAEKTVAGAQARLRRTRAEIERQRGRVLAAQDEQKKAQAALAAQKDALARQVRAAYMIGQQARAKLLLNQSDAQKLGRVITWYDYLNRARADKIRAIEREVARLAAAATRLKDETAALLALRQQQEQDLVGLQSSRQQRGAALARLRQHIQDARSELAQLQQNEREIRKLLDSLKDALADIPLDADAPGKPFPALKGKLPWPARGKLLAAYGQPKAGGRISWNGYWIDADEGAPVRVVARGRVAYVGWMHRYGLIIVVEHDAGYFSLYGHNASVAKAVGDWVDPGEVIAAAGNSGGYDQPGVYFEVRKGTQPLNPRDWLAR